MTAPLNLSIDRERLDWEAAIRAALSVALPLFTLYAVDRLDLAMAASFAAFTGLYGRREVYRKRVLTLAVAGLVVFSSICLGIGVQQLGSPWWLVALGFAVVVTVGVLPTATLKWIPRGSLFFVFAYLGFAVNPIPSSVVGDAVLVAALVVVWCWVLGMSGWVARRVPVVRDWMRPLVLDPERRLWDAVKPGNFWLIAASVTMGLLALLLAQTLGVATHHYWAAVTVVAIFSAPTALIRYRRIGHRVIGTLLGVGLAAALYGGSPHPLYVISVIVLCNLVTELIVGQHYGAALTFITPIAIGATSLGRVAEWEVLFVDRARETLLGGAVCFGLVFVLRYRVNTIMVWITFFIVMFGFYFANSWTPKLVVASGMTEQQGIMSGIMITTGGIIGAVLYGVFTARWAARYVFAGFVALGAVMLCVFILSTDVIWLAFGSALLVGTLMNGAVSGLYTVAPNAYGPRVRSTGVGVALGVGRAGAILAPIIVGALLDAGWTPTQLYIGVAVIVLFAVFAIIRIKPYVPSDDTRSVGTVDAPETVIVRGA